MNKEKHTIVLNGHRYNAKTGENLSHPGRPAAAKPASRHIQVHIEASHKAHEPARHPAGHVKAHSPKPARTLMRHAVKKPPGSLKRSIRVQGHLDSQIKQPIIETPVHAQVRQLRHHTGSQRHVKLITHFSPNLFSTVTHATVVAAHPEAPEKPASHGKAGPTMKPAFARTFKKPRTTAELLDYAIQYADSPLEPEEPPRRKHARKHRRAHAVAH